jgi:hypothetical protein
MAGFFVKANFVQNIIQIFSKYPDQPVNRFFLRDYLVSIFADQGCQIFLSA